MPLLGLAAVHDVVGTASPGVASKRLADSDHDFVMALALRWN